MNETKTISISDHITESRIGFYSKPITKLFIFSDLIGRFHYHKPEAAIQSILEREKAGSTIITPGVSVPHARLIDLPDVVASLGICLEGVQDPKGSETVRIFLLFLGPANNMKRNLDFLASVSSLFSTEGFMDEVLKATDASRVMAAIRGAEQNV